MITIGFVASGVDAGICMLHDKEDHSIVVAAVVLAVNDLLIIANKGLIGQIKDKMKKSFRIHDLGSVTIYLGMKIEMQLGASHFRHPSAQLHSDDLGEVQNG
jgi:hypothetical protein